MFVDQISVSVASYFPTSADWRATTSWPAAYCCADVAAICASRAASSSFFFAISCGNVSATQPYSTPHWRTHWSLPSICGANDVRAGRAQAVRRERGGRDGARVGGQDASDSPQSQSAVATGCSPPPQTFPSPPSLAEGPSCSGSAHRSSPSPRVPFSCLLPGYGGAACDGEGDGEVR